MNLPGKRRGGGEGGFDSPNEREEKGGGSDLPHKMGGGDLPSKMDGVHGFCFKLSFLWGEVHE